MKQLEVILENNTIRSTAMRLLTLKFLLDKKVAISLTDLENEFENSERTTLYRTLKTFVNKGIAHQINDGTGIAKYALCEENCNCEIDTDLHVHFHCSTCKETICLPKYKIPSINLPANFFQEEVNLIVKGVCDKCNQP